MKRLEVRLVERALEDLDEIGTYVYERSGSVATARSYVARIRSGCEILGEIPLGGRSREEVGPGVRSWPFERRAIFLYRPTSDSVDVLRVIHRGRQVRLLHDESERS